MSVIDRLFNGANRAEDKAERLRARGGLRNLQRARRLEQKAASNRQTLADWDKERWG